MVRWRCPMPSLTLYLPKIRSSITFLSREEEGGCSPTGAGRPGSRPSRDVYLVLHESVVLVTSACSASNDRRQRFRWPDSNPDVWTRSLMTANRWDRSRPMRSGWIPSRLILFCLFMFESLVVTCGLIALLDTSIVCKFVLLSI